MSQVVTRADFYGALVVILFTLAAMGAELRVLLYYIERNGRKENVPEPNGLPPGSTLFKTSALRMRRIAHRLLGCMRDPIGALAGVA